MAKAKLTFEKRSDIPEKYKWKVESIYSNDQEWEKEFAEYEKKLSEIDQFEHRLNESADVLLKAIETIHHIEMHVEKLYVYAHLKKDENTTNSFYQEMYQKAYGLYVKLSEKEAFFVPELLAMDESTINSFMEEKPALQLYRHFFDNIIRQKKHTLPKAQEELLAMGGEVFSLPGKVFSMLDNADIRYGKIVDENGEEVTLTKALYGKYQQHPDRRLRRDSYMTLYAPYIEHRNTLATNFYGVLQTHVFMARARKYSSTVEMALDRNNIPVKVYENLLDTVHQNLEPNHKYVSMRKKILKLDEVHDYDLLAPLAPSEHKEYTYEEAVEIIMEAFAPLGDQYLKDLSAGIDSGWIDVYENKGKRSGAYSSGGYLTQPFVLLNFSGTLNDIFTLAHELGHSMHSYYTRKTQPYVYGDYSIFLAEIASTLNEGLLTHYLLKQADSREKKIALLNEYLDKFARTFYRQVIFAEFELETHRWVENGQPVTADRLDEFFGDLYQKYHGDDLILDRETKAMWSRVPHFYYNYYVFQYATGIAASTALLQAILNDGKSAVDRYLKFLSAGNSDYPLNVLKEAGVDMTKPDPIKAVADTMHDLLNQLESLVF